MATATPPTPTSPRLPEAGGRDTAQAMPSAFRIPLLLCLALAPLAVLSAAAGDTGGVQNVVLTDDEIDQQFTDRRKELAARYRIDRARALPGLPDGYHRKAQQALTRAREALLIEDLPTARKVAEDAYERYPFSYAADDLLHCLLRSYAVSGDLREARLYLIDLWERFPSYDGFRDVLSECLVVAEHVQQRGKLFNFLAEHPRDVINEDALGDVTNANYLLHFLARHGDQHDVSPRATLGLARGILIRAVGNQDELVRSRLAYDEFLDAYPGSDLVFEALVEQAVSYLLSYRGEHYDMGALINAKALIEQADVYTGQDQDRQAVITKFRALIRRWHQGRDLQIARWYRDKDHVEQARYYYTEVIGKDSTSNSAAAARRERAELPEVQSVGLGSAGAER